MACCSERATSEVERTSGELVTQRIASEVDRVIRNRAVTTPAMSIDPTRVTQDELNQVETRLNTSMTALSKEIAELKARINDGYSDTQRGAAINKASVDDRLNENCRELTSLPRYLVKVDGFLKARFSNPETGPLGRP